MFLPYSFHFTAKYSALAQGITNGAEWYVVKGGMQDFNYLFSNCMEITVELSCCKYPLEDTLQGHWEDNREALLAYVEAVQAGLRGIVRDAEGEPVANAIIEVAGIEKNVTTSFRGEFWRLLSAGRYWQVMMMMMMMMINDDDDDDVDVDVDDDDTLPGDS